MAQLQRLVIRADQITNRQIALTDQQQHYLGRVLRLRLDDQFIAIDEQGQWWLAVLKPDMAAEVLEAIPVQTELSASLTLLMALPKSGMDDIVRQATEIGVRQIVPILSQRTVLNPSHQKLDRWQRIAQEAAEQAERQHIPEILSPQPWASALPTWNSTLGHCYLCEPRGNYPHLLSHLTHSPNLSQSSAYLLAIGPEGGWTDQEIEQAVAVGYQPVSLGKRILRSITAPVVALSLVAAVIETHSLQAE